MIEMQLFLIITIFLTAVFLHAVKKNIAAIWLYALQSLAVVVLMFGAFASHSSKIFFLVIFLTLLLKVLGAPLFFSYMVRKYQLTFFAATYTNLPIALIVVVALTMLAHSNIFSAVALAVGGDRIYLDLALAVIFISMFLIINRKGAVSQMIGILSLENGIVAFALFAGLEQRPGLEIGIIFDLFIWLIVATAFVAMIYKQFRSLDVTHMKILKD